MSKGCIDCKHRLAAYSKPVLVKENGFAYYETVDVPACCGLGHDAVYAQWWADNKTFIRGKDTFTENPCFEQTDSSKTLDEMLALTNEILAKL